jgi:hypothetical protein
LIDGTIVGFIPTRVLDVELRFSDGGWLPKDEVDIKYGLETGCYFDIEASEVEARLEKYREDRKKAYAAEKAWSDASDKRLAEWRAEKNAQEAELRSRPKARIGMTAKQVIETTFWGRPDEINRIETKYGVKEQWVYSHSRFLYFENGRLTAIDY